jgi:hypothetical protein
VVIVVEHHDVKVAECNCSMELAIQLAKPTGTCKESNRLV